MAATVKGEQFNAQGKRVRDVDITLQRPTQNDAYTGNYVMHLDIGSRLVSISISPEDWEKLRQVGQETSSGRHRAWEPVSTPPSHMWQQPCTKSHRDEIPHCRTHLEFRSDCADCEREREYHGGY